MYPKKVISSLVKNNSFICASLLTLLILIISCSNKKDSTDGDAGTVKGKVTTSDGKPLPGAKVTISSVIWYNSNNVVSTGADGTYSRQLSEINNDAWYAYASIDKEFNGKIYHMDLHPESTDDFFPGKGAVRNFTWKLTGNQVGRSTGVYGGTVTVAAEPGTFYDFTNVTLKMEPQGTLIDGSTGQTITRKIDVSQRLEVPVGRYKVSAVYAPAGQSPVQMKIRLSDTGNYGTTAIVDFTPETNYCKNCMTLDVKP
jgi:hypothetical protein